MAALRSGVVALLLCLACFGSSVSGLTLLRGGTGSVARNSSSAAVAASVGGAGTAAQGWARFAQDSRFKWPAARSPLFNDREVALFPALDLSHGKPGERAPLVTRVIRGLSEKTEVFEILEVGVWLGGTVAEWTTASPKVRVAAMDPWELSHYEDPKAAVCRGHCTPELAKVFADHKDQAFFGAAEARLWPLRDSVVLVRGKAPQAFDEVAEAGLSPNLLFLDGGKSKANTFEWNYNFLTGVLEGARKRWSSAWLAGDDWHWAANKGGLKNGKAFIQSAVLDFVAKHPDLGCRMEGHFAYVVGPVKEVNKFSTKLCA